MIKINFNEPHPTYRLKDGTIAVSVTTAMGSLNKPALPVWGFNTGRTPRFESIPEAAQGTGVNLKKMTKDAAIRWAFSVGQERKFPSLYGNVDKAADIGTVAHEILRARELKDEIDNSNIEPKIWELALQSVKSHDKWFQDMTMETILFEKLLVSEKHKYGGKPDKLALISNEETLLDYKSGKDIYDEYWMQVTAYAVLLLEHGYNPTRCMIINMPKAKGDNFKIESRGLADLLDAGHFELFIAARDAYYAGKKIKAHKEVDLG